jgi:hypothetical protein
METVIVICLLIVIALLLQDKIVISIRKEQKPIQQKLNPSLPDIMGQPKPLRSLLLPKGAKESQKKKKEKKSNNFKIEIDHDKNINIQIPQEEQEDVFSNEPDFEEEEEEWNSYGISGGNDGLAQGVTFEELSVIGMFLQKDNLEPSQKETAVAIVQKIQGTELFTLLENSVESASRKIAELLDGSPSSETDYASSIIRKNDLSGFDIGEFV